MASAPPAKPWERAGAVQAQDGAPKPWEQAPAGTTAVAATSAALAATAQQPARPWEAGGGGALTSTSYSANPYSSSVSPYGGGGAYGSSMYGAGGGMYSRPGMYGSSMYGGAAGGGMYGSSYGSSYGGGMYGSSMYGGGYGSGMYGGGGLGTGGMYGSGMYGGGGGGGMYGSSMYGGGGGMYGGGGPMYGGMPPPGFDPSRPPAPPSAWQAVLGAVGGVVHFFGRLSFLVDENAHAVHFFVSALLQLLDRAGSLYGELARFILRVIFKRRPPPKAIAGPHGPMQGPHQQQHQQQPGFGGPLGGALSLPPRPGMGGAPWQPPSAPSALPPPGSGSPIDLPSGSHWDSLWGDS
ncbi:hypothetical protein Rsub_08036 [Raphidocelis subcapitata]|uniref:Peroxin-13 n=1 Tax=Raphidocelis subcapitata TaxID=307507 RepID=A0A2V0P4S1_9CHLO|nr:hypothetical protein Rsub_08036 [Raphidocelis subcapitata]|eukprot:GBF94864.1 hypothetical protein Rsub_08036 [Raphidocelis subcapitata]